MTDKVTVPALHQMVMVTQAVRRGAIWRNAFRGPSTGICRWTARRKKPRRSGSWSSWTGF